MERWRFFIKQHGNGLYSILRATAVWRNGNRLKNCKKENMKNICLFIVEMAGRVKPVVDFPLEITTLAENNLTRSRS
jgi:hypothetical protein